MYETGAEPAFPESVPAPVTAPHPPMTALVVVQTTPVHAQTALSPLKRPATQRQLEALAAARVARSAKAAARKAEHARMSERTTVEHSSSDEDVEYIIKRVRRKAVKPRDDGESEIKKTPVAPTKEAPSRRRAARDSSSDEEQDARPVRQRGVLAATEQEIYFV